jgi:hypothetical protein
MAARIGGRQVRESGSGVAGIESGSQFKVENANQNSEESDNAKSDYDPQP